MNDTLQTHKAELAADLRKAIDDAQLLLRDTTGAASEEIAGVRDRIKGLLDQSRKHLGQLEHEAIARAGAAGHAANNLVHQRPWQSIGVAAGIGLLLGLLIGRR